ncbi:MAG: hypothetical protein KA313_07685 [Pseudarcicella sp.]|nr:hypothetical protein [Pseudarcicella sp.]MBP6410961.1 hypothetical protein [Pseudarcicella sp.]
MNKFFTLFALAIISLLFTNCGKVDEVNPQTAIINKWTIDKIIVKSGSETYTVPLSSAKNVNIDMFTIDTDEITFKADSNLNYLESGKIKNGKWFLSENKKELNMLDSYNYKYNATIAISDDFLTLYGKSIDPGKRSFTYDEQVMYDEIFTALYSINVYKSDIEGQRFLQLGVQYKKN